MAQEVIDRLRLDGHLTRESLEAELRRAALRTPVGGHGVRRRVLLDCGGMMDYDLDARHAFVDWLKEARPAKVAIVTDRELWHLVVRTMALASGVQMMPFFDETTAVAWLRS